MPPSMRSPSTYMANRLREASAGSGKEKVPSRRKGWGLKEVWALVCGPPPPRVAERWTGTYASAKDRLMLIDRPADALRIVLITSGTGASTSFAIAEEVVADLYGRA